MTNHPFAPLALSTLLLTTPALGQGPDPDGVQKASALRPLKVVVIIDIKCKDLKTYNFPNGDDDSYAIAKKLIEVFPRINPWITAKAIKRESPESRPRLDKDTCELHTAKPKAEADQEEIEAGETRLTLTLKMEGRQGTSSCVLQREKFGSIPQDRDTLWTNVPTVSPRDILRIAGQVEVLASHLAEKLEELLLPKATLEKLRRMYVLSYRVCVFENGPSTHCLLPIDINSDVFGEDRTTKASVLLSIPVDDTKTTPASIPFNGNRTIRIIGMRQTDVKAPAILPDYWDSFNGKSYGKLETSKGATLMKRKVPANAATSVKLGSAELKVALSLPQEAAIHPLKNEKDLDWSRD